MHSFVEHPDLEVLLAKQDELQRRGQRYLLGIDTHTGEVTCEVAEGKEPRQTALEKFLVHLGKMQPPSNRRPAPLAGVRDPKDRPKGVTEVITISALADALGEGREEVARSLQREHVGPLTLAALRWRRLRVELVEMLQNLELAQRWIVDKIKLEVKLSRDDVRDWAWRTLRKSRRGREKVEKSRTRDSNGETEGRNARENPDHRH